jgi:hypothetical protein
MKTYLLIIRDIVFLFLFIRLLFLETNNLYLILEIIGSISTILISNKDKLLDNIQN